MLKIEQISKRYGSLLALKPLDLAINKGEFITLLGSSGSGKTTLLQLIAGLIEPSSGRLFINGRDATWLHPSERGLGMVFQSYALFPHLSIAENIAFPLRMRGFSEQEIRERVQGALEMVRLPEISDRLPKQLSGGQQQRVALARCLVYRPEIILMDEPLGALDKKLREHMQIEIKRIHRETGTTVVYVTHDQEEALSMSDRICLMRDGNIEQFGTPDQLYYEPQSAYVADFLGQPNCLHAIYSHQDGDTSVVKTNTGELRGRASVHLNKGDVVHVLVRPESLALTEQAASGENRITGEVVDVSMIGPMTKVHVRTGTGSDMMAIRLSEKTSPALSRGHGVTLSWSSADCRIVGV
jgi:putative spermidine/putrescine transport system ATP-binding protein